MEGEHFDIKKLFNLNGIGFAKVVGLGFKAGLLVLIIFGLLWIKGLLFPSAPANVNQPEIHVAEGGTLHYAVSQTSEKKRPWYLPSPFVEVFSQADTNHDDLGYGLRFGARWEF